MDTVNLSVRRIIFLQVSMYIERLSLLRLENSIIKGILKPCLEYSAKL